MRHYGIELDVFKEQAAQAMSRQELGFATNDLLIGTVARLVPQKGMRYWLDAAALVARDLPDARFVIIGDGELRASLERQAHHLGISRRVSFLGASETPWRILAACDFVAFSSLYEGLPQTGIEALAAGVPLVATRMKGTEEIIRDGWNGLLVPTRDSRGLAHGMLRLARDPALRAQMHAVGPDSVKEYRTEIMIDRFRQAYERLYAEFHQDARVAVAVSAVSVTRSE